MHYYQITNVLWSEKIVLSRLPHISTSIKNRTICLKLKDGYQFSMNRNTWIKWDDMNNWNSSNDKLFKISFGCSLYLQQKRRLYHKVKFIILRIYSSFICKTMTSIEICAFEIKRNYFLGQTCLYSYLRMKKYKVLKHK